MQHIQLNVVQSQQETSRSTQQLDLHNNNEFLVKFTEEQISKAEKEIFFTLNNSKKIYDYLDNHTAFVVIPQEYQQSLQQCSNIKNNAEFFKVFKRFLQSKEFNHILKSFIDDLKLLKQLIGFYLKDDSSCNTRQIGIDNLIRKLGYTAGYELQNPNNLLEMFSVTRENINIIVAVISKLKTTHENISLNTTNAQQINNPAITVEALTELIIEYCDMFGACWSGISFRMLSLQQGLKYRLAGKSGIICKVKNELLTALSKESEQQLIAIGEKKHHPAMLVHIISYLNYQVADKFGIFAIKDIYINNDIVKGIIPPNLHKLTDIQLEEYKNTAKIVLSSYNINLNLASNLLDSFNTLIELYGGLKIGDNIAFSKEKVNQIEEQERRFLFNDLYANVIEPTSLLYENTLLVNDLIIDKTINDVDSYVFENILPKLQGFTAQALSPAESQRLIIDIPQELNKTKENLAIAAIGSCYFWVINKNQLAENQAVKLDLTEYIKLEVSHIPKNLVNITAKYFYRSLVTQALQQTKDAQAIIDFIDRCDINEYLQQDAAFKQYINQIISNKITIIPELKDQLIECIFYNGNYIENDKFKFSYAAWFIESTLCEPLAIFFAENSIDIIDFINQLSIKSLLQFKNKYSLNHIRIIAEKAIVNKRDTANLFYKKYFNALFFKLMEYGNSPVILKLFHSGLIDSYLDKIAKNGYNLLMILVKNKDTVGINLLADIIKKTEKKYPNININNIHNYVLNLVRYGNKADIQAIFNLNQQLPDTSKIKADDLMMFFMDAWGYQNIEVLKYLLSLNLTFNTKNSNNQTTLMLACDNANIKYVEFLLENDENINLDQQNNNSDTALIIACRHGYIECIKLLIESGKNIDINVQNQLGCTALMAICHLGKAECLQPLLDSKGINLNMQNIEGHTALMLACYHGNTECVRLLLASGKNIDLNIKNKKGTTALLTACDKSNNGCIKLLLKYKGIDINMHMGSTALMLACYKGNTECVKLLLEYKGIDINMLLMGKTALISACYQGNTECVKLLLESGKVNMNIQDKYGNTALAIAIRGKYTSCVDFLLSYQIKNYRLSI